MKKPIPTGAGLAISKSLYSFDKSNETENKIATYRRKNKYLYASRCADYRTPFIQEQGGNNE